MTATDSPATDVYYDPYDLAINADPYPTFHRLMEEAPVYHNERYDFWALSRHADVEKALLNWQTFSNSRSDILELIKSGFDMPKGVMMFEDPPTHTMLRGLMSRVFTPRRMAEIEDQIRRYCIACLDPLVGTDGFDISGELAAMTMVDAAARKLPGALGNEESLADETFSDALDGGAEYPHYTRPVDFRGWTIPEILTSGHHGRIAEWRRQQSRLRTERQPPAGRD